jgi:flagellar biosynthesis/type III secretory pathway chaperone
MEQAQLVSAFKATVQASLHGLETLESTLEAERAALTGRDPTALETVVKEKIALLQQLQHSVQARDRLLKTAGFVTGNPGGDAFVAAVNEPQLTDDWSTLLERATRVARLNDRNGQLANQGQRATQTAIGILTGHDQTEPTYAPARRNRRARASYTRAIA